MKDAQGAAAASEVTLWAVDYGVLSLTGYRDARRARARSTCDKALQVLNDDNRQRIIRRRVLTPKGDDEGGGGGADAGAGTLRKDFRVLAFWLGSVATDAHGQRDGRRQAAGVADDLPDHGGGRRRASRFGSGDSEIRINKPVTLQPAFPRFLAVGDRALVRRGRHQPAASRRAPRSSRSRASIRRCSSSTAPRSRRVAGRRRRIGRGAVRRRRRAAIGRARVQMTVAARRRDRRVRGRHPGRGARLAGDGRGATAKPRRDAAIETLDAARRRRARRSAGCTSSCRRPRWSASAKARGISSSIRTAAPSSKASRALALLLAADLGDAFTLPGIDAGADASGRAADAARSSRRSSARTAASRTGRAPAAIDVAVSHGYLLHVFKVAGGPEVRRRRRRCCERAYALSRDASWRSRRRPTRAGGPPTPRGRRSR